MTASVYVIRDVDGEVIYVGQSVDVDNRLRQHRRTASWAAEIDRVETYPMADQWEAELAERQFINDLSPRHNSLTYTSQIGSPRQALPAHTVAHLRQMLNDARAGGAHSDADAVLSNFIKLLRVNGWTLAAIGEPLGWSREAVRMRETRGELVGYLPIPPLPPRPKMFHTPPKTRRLHVRPEVAEHLRALNDIARRCRSTRDDDHPNRQASRELSAMLATLVTQGVTVAELARCCGVTHLAIRARLNRHGYGASPPPRGLFGQRSTALTHCRRGHELAGDNLYIAPTSGHRKCKTCQRRREAERQARRAGAAA